MLSRVGKFSSILAGNQFMPRSIYCAKVCTFTQVCIIGGGSAINSLSHTQQLREDFSSGWRKFLFWDFNGCVAGSSLHISADRLCSEGTTGNSTASLLLHLPVFITWLCWADRIYLLHKKPSGPQWCCASHETARGATNWNWRQSIGERQQQLSHFTHLFEPWGKSMNQADKNRSHSPPGYWFRLTPQPNPERLCYPLKVI